MHMRYTVSMTVRQLTRSYDERMISSVRTRLGRYFAVDATLVRGVFVLMALVSGVGLVAHVLLAALMPAKRAHEGDAAERTRHRLRDMSDGVNDMAARTKAVLYEQRTNLGSSGNALSPQMILGLGIILVGVAVLLSRFIDLWFLAWRFGWPAIIIAAVVLVLLRARR